MASRRSGPFRAYRIADGRRPMFDGTGAALYGGRWNSPGRRVIYAATTFSGALLEALAHTGTGRIPRNHAYIVITIPPEVRIEEVTSEDLPGWDTAEYSTSREYGNRWYDERRSAVLITPSVITPFERNVVIHEEHPDSRKISASDPKPVVWDRRLFRGISG
jgi:RES domain-containing protein